MGSPFMRLLRPLRSKLASSQHWTTLTIMRSTNKATPRPAHAPSASALRTPLNQSVTTIASNTKGSTGIPWYAARLIRVLLQNSPFRAQPTTRIVHQLRLRPASRVPTTARVAFRPMWRSKKERSCKRVISHALSTLLQ
jgi:hypothetical protein